MFYRFILSGLLNTVFGYFMFAAVLFYSKDSQLSLNVSYFLGSIFNYISYRFITFKSGSYLIFLRFFITYFVLLLANKILLYQLKNLANLNDYLLQIICLPIMVVLSWYVFRRFVFKK